MFQQQKYQLNGIYNKIILNNYNYNQQQKKHKFREKNINKYQKLKKNN